MQLGSLGIKYEASERVVVVWGGAEGVSQNKARQRTKDLRIIDIGGRAEGSLRCNGGNLDPGKLLTCANPS